MDKTSNELLEQFARLCREREAELTRYADISDSGTSQMHFDFLASAYETVGKDLEAMLNKT